MPAQATLNHAAQVLAGITSDLRADTALRFYFDSHRYLSPAERRQISQAIFSYYRWLEWLDAKAPPQRRIEQAVELQARFNADARAVKAEAMLARAVPAWVWEELDFTGAADPAAARAAYARQLQREPTLWLRSRPGRAAELAQALAGCVPAERVADALAYTGTVDLYKSAPFQAGAFEIQDLASQLVGHAAAPAAGETWWDACAGEGGKLLHLADLMRNRGLIWASDRHTGRLEALKRRAARARIFNYRATVWDGGPRLPTKTRFDGILVDAPCSGVGTWQRNPQARWTTGPEDVQELKVTQLNLLHHVAGALKPGGRLIYSVCTLTRSETTGVADLFAAAHPELEPWPLPIAAAGAADPSRVVLWPHEFNANGMFLAGWRRKPA